MLLVLEVDSDLLGRFKKHEGSSLMSGDENLINTSQGMQCTFRVKAEEFVH